MNDWPATKSKRVFGDKMLNQPKKIIWITITTLAMVLFSYALVNYFKQHGGEVVPVTKNRRDFSPKIELQISNPITIVPSSDGTIDTQNWPVYKSADLGFEIKYPTGWGIKRLYSTYVEGEIVFLAFSPVPEDFFISINILTTPFAKVVESESGKNLISTKTVTTSGISLISQITKGNPLNPDTSYVFYRDNYTYIMRGPLDLMHAMLATFSFIS